MGFSRQELFENAPIHKAYFALTIPSVLGKVVMLLYNMADTWFIASTNDAYLVAGVAICGPIFTLMLAFGDVFGMGGSSVISRLLGQGKTDQAKRVSGFCFYTNILFGVIMGALLLIFQIPILTMLGADENTLPHAVQYYRWIALGAPFIIAPVVPLNLFRSEGMAKASVSGSILGSIVNVILDPIFIFVLGMGAAGAAIATILGNVASLALYIFFIRRKAQVLTISPKEISRKRDETSPVFAIGIPASVNNLMNSFGQAVGNRFLLLYGADKIAAAGIASKINMIPIMMIVGFAFSAGPLVGYNYGNGDRDRLKKIIRFFYCFQIGMATLVGAVLMIFAPVLVKGFMEDPGIVTAGTEYLRWHLAGMPFTAIFMVSSCLMQATGNAKNALTLSLSRQGIVFLVVMVAANWMFGYPGVVSAQTVTDIISALIAAGLVFCSLGKYLRSEKTA